MSPRRCRGAALAFLGVSEMRWNACGKFMTATGETVLHSRMDKGENHEGGVGFTLSRDAVQSLLEWEPVSERIIRVRFSSKRQQVTVLQCYALPQKIKQRTKRRHAATCKI